MHSCPFALNTNPVQCFLCLPVAARALVPVPSTCAREAALAVPSDGHHTFCHQRLRAQCDNGQHHAGPGHGSLMLDAPFMLFFEPGLRQLRAAEEEVWAAVRVEVVSYMSLLGRQCGSVAQGSQKQSRQRTAAGDQRPPALALTISSPAA